MSAPRSVAKACRWCRQVVTLDDRAGLWVAPNDAPVVGRCAANPTRVGEFIGRHVPESPTTRRADGRTP